MRWSESVISVLEDKKAKDIRQLDVSSVFPFADTMVFATGTSSRQLITLCSAIERFAKDHGEKAMVQGKQEGSWWIVISLPSLFVHLFLEEAREHYRLEELWGNLAQHQHQRQDDATDSVA